MRLIILNVNTNYAIQFGYSNCIRVYIDVAKFTSFPLVFLDRNIFVIYYSFFFNPKKPNYLNISKVEIPQLMESRFIVKQIIFGFSRILFRNAYYSIASLNCMIFARNIILSYLWERLQKYKFLKKRVYVLSNEITLVHKLFAEFVKHLFSIVVILICLKFRYSFMWLIISFIIPNIFNRILTINEPFNIGYDCFNSIVSKRS